MLSTFDMRLWLGRLGKLFPVLLALNELLTLVGVVFVLYMARTMDRWRGQEILFIIYIDLAKPKSLKVPGLG